MEELNITLNGKNLTGKPGETILSLAKRNNIEIPTLCHDPRLEPFTSCYLCVVEVEGAKGLEPACSTKIAEGMVVNTENEKGGKGRKMALDLLVSNHFADCEAPCKQTCPAGVDVQAYISLIEKGLYSEAVEVIKQVNPLPAICGRVCVRPCEVACRRNFLDEGTAVGIDYLKRFTSDIDLESPKRYVPKVEPSTGKKVAIIGAGPGGLSCGWFLQLNGHQCDIFEANEYAGGWLRYGIPEYRLPNDLLQKEVDAITELGVNIHYGKRLGKNLSYSELKDRYDAVILTIGSQRGTLIGCDGEDAQNVFSGIDFLRNMEMTGQRYDFSGKTVAVVGGGNTAMDCCRTSVRCGAEKVIVIYRRTEKEMPANPIEIHESKIEGVEYMFLTNPVLVNKNEKGEVKSVTCIKMELGEPDSSGRRRPVPIEGSEFDVGVDYILAAIGQKTEVDFLDDINSNASDGQLKLNKWGDIDADPQTLQTGIPNVFAAGDGVTGPATIIEAIDQAKTASKSCHRYLTGEKPEAEEYEFISKRENFRELKVDDFTGRYRKQFRHEMPTLPPEERMNFNEVELGYENEEVAVKEAERCFECGCSEFFTCDLKKYATRYKAVQDKFTGEFKEYEVDFSHPYVEIDNTKCILCSRCIRICNEVNGANALGLVNRGFETYVAPSLGDSLSDTRCESCGLFISTCPTAALTENTAFKPLPVELDKATAICNYCSIGCEINLHYKNRFVVSVSGTNGQVNKNGNICRYAMFGYHYLNDRERITKPMKKVNGEFKEIDFEEALDIIVSRIKSVEPDRNSFFGGARLTNEELYLVQKLARAGAKTNNVGSFHYLGRGDGYMRSSDGSVPLDLLKGASKIYLLGSEINRDNAVAGFTINNMKVLHNVPVELVTDRKESSMEHKVDKKWEVKSYYHFVKALNHFYLSANLQNDLYIKDNCEEFEKYREALLKEDFEKLYKKSGFCCEECFNLFAEDFNKQKNAVLLFSEKEVSSETVTELFNLAMITGKLGKTVMGLLALKEKNNSQGVFDMGVDSRIGPGRVPLDDRSYADKLKKAWKIEELPPQLTDSQMEMLESGEIKNIFVFGEDPAGCADDSGKVKKWFEKADFVAVQDYFMTDTVRLADLILPASMPVETGGSFTNTGRVIQQFSAVFDPLTEKTNIGQLAGLIERLGANRFEGVNEVREEIFGILAGSSSNSKKFRFRITSNKNAPKLFGHGCDFVVKRFDEEFEKAFKK